MDEHIVRDLLQLPLDSKEAGQLEDIIRRCGQATVSMIRHEQIEPQSPMAFHVFARACRTMFRIGAAIELKTLGIQVRENRIGTEFEMSCPNKSFVFSFLPHNKFANNKKKIIA